MIFSRKIEPKPLTIPSFFNRSVREYAGRPAVSFVNGTPITYAELGRQVDELARKLYALGLQPGDKVALLGHNMPNWVVAYFAATTTGLVIVPILPDFTREEVENVLSHSEAKVLLVSERLYVKVEGLALPHLQATFKLDNLALLDGSLPAGGLPPVPSAEVLHLGHHGPFQGRDVVAPQHHLRGHAGVPLPAAGRGGCVPILPPSVAHL